jgi:hypothetical protein
MPTLDVRYPDELTMREARDRYFEANRFGADGGYSAKWVDIKLGPIPMPFPNSAARVRAVKYHDLHHVLTGYDTDFRGEFEISAWEIAAGCKGFAAAWVLNLGGMVGGMFTSPRRTFRAWVRGRRDRTVYDEDYEALLAMRVGEARDAYLRREEPRATAADALLFAVALWAGTVVGALELAFALPLMPFGVVALRLAKKRSEVSA